MNIVIGLQKKGRKSPGLMNHVFWSIILMGKCEPGTWVHSWQNTRKWRQYYAMDDAYVRHIRIHHVYRIISHVCVNIIADRATGDGVYQNNALCRKGGVDRSSLRNILVSSMSWLLNSPDMNPNRIFVVPPGKPNSCCHTTTSQCAGITGSVGYQIPQTT